MPENATIKSTNKTTMEQNPTTTRFRRILIITAFAVLLLQIVSTCCCVVGGGKKHRDEASTDDSTSCGEPSTKYPSGSSFNCSFNGVCSRRDDVDNGGSYCSCFPGWTGRYCETLDLLPVASNESGLNLLHNTNKNKSNNPTSTWGGSVLWDNDTQLYHMFASEILYGCGIHRWVSNSIVVRATSRGPKDNWKFVRKERLWGLFSHEPIAARDPTTHEVAVFFTHYPGDTPDCPTCYCKDGNSASGQQPGCRHKCGHGKNNRSLFSYFSFAPNLTTAEGGTTTTWSNPTSLSRVQGNIRTDMNLAPILRADGSLLAWTRWNIWEATDWKNPDAYVDTGQAPDFDSKPYPTPWEGEDPSMWVDRDGIYHMISHNGKRGKAYPHNASGDCGRHYFSETGKAGTWRVAPLLHPKDLGGCAYPRTVPFVDGSEYTFCRRERPHLILGPDGLTPVALSTSVMDSPVDGTRDASYTLVQPIRNNKHNIVNNKKEKS